MEVNSEVNQSGLISERFPAEWMILKVADITTDHKQGYYTNEKYVDYGTPIVRITDLLNPRINFEEMPRLIVSRRDIESFKIKCGDFLIARSGSIGRYGIVYDEVEAIFGSFVIRFNFDPQLILNEFFGYLYEMDFSLRQLLSITQGSSNININATNIKDLWIPVPPLPEQRAIAEVLSDVDAQIAALEALIAKKRAIMQGAMQELLTGKRRLPGFTGEWEVKKLGEVATVRKGSQLPAESVHSTGDFAYLNGGILPSGYTNNNNTEGNTIAISEGGNSCGFVQFMSSSYWCAGHCYSVIPTGVHNRFLYFSLKAQEPEIMRLRVGSGLPNVQRNALLGFEIRVMLDAVEQAAIAEVLSDMDIELAVLDEQLGKVKNLKQGLMQELLTGKTRLV